MKRDLAQQRFLIADKAGMYAAGLESFFGQNPIVGAIEVARSKLELIESMDERPHDLLIIEPWCPRPYSAGTDIEFLRAVRSRYPHQPMVVFTGENSPRILRKIARMERTGVTSKSDDLRDVLAICQRVMLGEPGALSGTIARMLEPSD
jgi:DNA-binding NarL/FixJ family response regulator